ncbi:MAG: acyl carrier protein [Phycisphaeraceae bacterium]|nr:acyl carrier protein [Phycisphaerales bacterium]MCB9860799.1 acyl carrier protein [Phycisphaeraceae bacterium]
MTRDEIFDKVKELLVDALAVDDEEVEPSASLTRDLGAESIDFLDIGFKLQQTFGFEIASGELFPDNVTQDPEFVKDGKVTEKGMASLKNRMPHADFSELEGDPRVDRVAEIFTVNSVVNFVQQKLAAVS